MATIVVPVMTELLRRVRDRRGGRAGDGDGLRSQSKFWRLALVVAAVLVAVVVLVGAGLVLIRQPHRALGGEGDQAVPVTVAQAVVRPVDVTVRLPGVVASVSSAAVYASAAGPVVAVDVVEGQAVTAGQRIARIDDTQGLAAKVSSARAQVAKANADLQLALDPAPNPQAVAQAQGQVDQAGTALRQARANLARDEAASPGVTDSPQLRADRQAVADAQAQLDAANQRLAQANDPPPVPQSQIDAARAALDAADAQLAAASAAYDSLTVTAPFAGTIVKVAVVVGSAATPGQALAQISGGGLQVVATASPADAAQVAGHTGTAATITLSATGRDLSGVVTAVAPTADAGQQTTVTVSLAAAADARAGDPVTAQIVIAQGEGIAVPVDAVVYRDGRPYVFTVPAGAGTSTSTVTMAGVQVGVRTATYVQITAGLSAGQAVVVRGSTALVDGAQVAVVGTTAIAAAQTPDTSPSQ